MSSSERHAFPFKIVPLADEVQQHIADNYRAIPNGLASCNHWGSKLSATVTAGELEEFYNHPLDVRDIWLVSPPKCGVTWTQEMVWLIANDLDYEGAKTPLSPGRWTFPDFPLVTDKQAWAGDLMLAQGDSSSAEEDLRKQEAAYREPPRFVKCHTPISMINPRLLDTCKVIYVARNPKDVCISYFHHQRLFPKTHDFVGDLEMFMEDFMKGLQQNGPVLEHLLEAWNLRHHPNMCFLFFEDMKRNLKSQIGKVADFLGKTLRDSDVEKLSDHLHLDNFRRNQWCNKHEQVVDRARGAFVRKGETGDWKNYFTPEMNATFDRWLVDKLKGSDICFTMELDG